MEEKWVSFIGKLHPETLDAFRWELKLRDEKMEILLEKIISKHVNEFKKIHEKCMKKINEKIED